MTTKNRRPKGTGSVYKDEKRGQWVGQITFDGRRHKVRGRTKTDVNAKLAKLVAARESGASVPSGRRTVADAVATFLERGLPNRGRGGRPLSPRTVELYEWTAGLIVADIGKVKLSRLTVDHVEAMLDRLAAGPKPLSLSSLRQVRGTLQRSLAFAVRRGEADRNVVDAAELPANAAPEQKRRSLSPEDARTLLEAFRGERLGLAYALMLRVGLRPGEAAGIYWDDIGDGLLNVTRSVKVAPSGHADISDDLKSESSKRTIELPAELVEWVAEHRAAQVAERLAASTWVDDRLVTTTTIGTVVSPRNMRRDLNRICDAAGVDRVRPNELRHSAASLLSDLGVSNEAIADLLGHNSTRMVDQTYRHRLRPVVDVAARNDWTAAEGDA